MSLPEDSQELVEISELVGRQVTVFIETEERSFEGKLHSLSNHGVLIKEKISESYFLFPWHVVERVIHGTPKYVDVMAENTRQIEETTPEWNPTVVESTKSIINANTPEDYEWDWQDSDEDIAEITDEDGETAVVIDLRDPQDVTVYMEKDFELAKTFAKQFNISKIIKEY